MVKKVYFAQAATLLMLALHYAKIRRPICPLKETHHSHLTKYAGFLKDSQDFHSHILITTSRRPTNISKAVIKADKTAKKLGYCLLVILAKKTYKT